MPLQVACSLLLGFCQTILLGLRFALLPTCLDLLRRPSLIPKVSQVYMAHLWAVFGDGADESARPMKESVISAHAYGVVLDLGAGYGHTIQYLDRTKVTRYVAVEPNALMHTKLCQVANQFGYIEADGSLVILGCGAEEIDTILAKVDEASHPFDTIISVLTMCSLPSPRETLTKIVKGLLKPGGQLLFYEHVRSPRDDVARWQSFYEPIWGVFFDGCRLGQPSDVWVEDMKDVDEHGKQVWIWDEGRCWNERLAEEVNLTWIVMGRFVRKGGLQPNGSTPDLD
ncbi:hypothetical protein WG66_004669 [Moniliophthora roreri]|nr:hypothetical protein WG66_004669 [Moniliophthora roreri]